MKILNVNMSVDPIGGGGTAERTFQMSRSLADFGVESFLISTDIGLTHERIKEMRGVQFVALHCIIKRFYIPTFSYNKIKNVVKNVDIIHMMNHWTVLNAIIYFFARRFNKPYVVCPAGALPIYGRSGMVKEIYNFIIGKRIIRYADGHVAIGSNEIDQFQAYGIESKKITLIPNGINVEDFEADDIIDFRRKYGLGDNPLIMFMGRLNAIKGPDLLLRAFYNLKDRLHDYHLIFVGPDSGMINQLKDMVKEFDIEDRVNFVGYLGGSDKSQAYHAADLLVIPSRQEAMSIVVLEAGATGTPVLLTDQCGFDEIAQVDGGNVVPASVNGLQKGLIEMLSNPQELKLKGSNLKKYVYEKFTWNAVIKKYIYLFKKICE